MDQLLKILQKDALTSPETAAKMLNITTDEVRAQIRSLIESRKILGYRAVLDQEALAEEKVRAVIEVRITPERGGGFDHLAERISRFDEVTSCHLVSGGYDLLVFVEARTLQDVARFVSQKLSTLGGVLSTATHFMLKSYKDQGLVMRSQDGGERLAVTP